MRADKPSVYINKGPVIDGAEVNYDSLFFCSSVMLKLRLYQTQFIKSLCSTPDSLLSGQKEL